MDVFNKKTDKETTEKTAMTETGVYKHGEREELNKKLRQSFDGKIVRKDLTKHIKEGANVPIYVLEYLLGQYCNSDDEAIIERGVETVKSILANNYVRPDEAQKVLSVLRKKGSHTVIDLITVELNMKYDEYEATFSNLGLTRIPISEDYPEQYDCFAVASGASFSLNMELKMMTLVKWMITVLSKDKRNQCREMIRRYQSRSLRLYRCQMLTWDS